MMPFIPLIGVPSATRDWVCGRDGHCGDPCTYCTDLDGVATAPDVKSWDNDNCSTDIGEARQR